MDNTTLVSVIIPVYNVESYLDRCVQSIVNQTYQNLEIILVDDGSPDRSPAMCDAWAVKDSRIKVIHKENGGVSSARNAGLDSCEGEYIFFVDSDDFVLSDYIECFMDNGRTSYVAGGFCVNSPDGINHGYTDFRLFMEEYKKDCRNNWAKIPSVHVWGNRYSKSIIKTNNLKFDVGCGCGEDVRFNVKYFMCIDELQTISQSGYIYCIREGSAINSFWKNRLEEEREEAKYQLKNTIKDQYFKGCIGYMLRDGSIDMKIEAICLLLGSYRMYKRILQTIKCYYR